MEKKKGMGPGMDMGMMKGMMEGMGDMPDMWMKMGEKVMGSITETAHMASFATPEVRGLFEDWARTVEEEILQYLKEKGSALPADIAGHLKISEKSAIFFIGRLAGEGELHITGIRIWREHPVETLFTVVDRKRIEEAIRDKYRRVAEAPQGQFRYPTGRAGLEGLGYDEALIARLPEEAVLSYCGVGNPFSLGPIREGEAVLDVGCGGGVDTMVAAMKAGTYGKAVGIDLIPEMLERAERNLAKSGLANVALKQASGESLPFPDASFDVVISNGSFNLIPDKQKALLEALRVLKPGGRLMMADQVLITEIPADAKSMVETWAGWQGGAIPGKAFLAMIEQAGFIDAKLVGDTGFDSSPVTKGVLIRSGKAAMSAQ